MERRAQVKQAIVDAFDHVPYPGDEAIVLDLMSYRGEKIQEELKGQSWRSLPGEVSSGWSAIFLRPEARRFYWPAFLLAALDMLPKGRTGPALYALIPPEDSGRFTREYDAYTQAQRHAIRLFLEYARDEAPEQDVKNAVEIALERYWGRDEGNPPSPAQRTPVELTGQEKIRQIIRDAFAEVPYPGDDSLVPQHCSEEEEIRQDFKGYHWREVPHALIFYNYFALSFFSAKGIQFYLPAYLCAALEGDGEILTHVVYHLAISLDDPDLVDWFKTRHEDFSPAQRRAIRLFLEYVRDEMNDKDLERHARRALEAYWATDP